MPPEPGGGAARRLLSDQRVRFVLVGGVNTVLSLALFIVFQLWFGQNTYSFVPLGLAWIISLICVFFPHRLLVFKVRGQVLRDFGRFVMVNAGAFGINVGALFLASDVLGWPTIPCQLVISAVSVVISFLGHKHFSFRRPRTPADEPRAAPDSAEDQR